MNRKSTREKFMRIFVKARNNWFDKEAEFEATFDHPGLQKKYPGTTNVLYISRPSVYVRHRLGWVNTVTANRECGVVLLDKADGEKKEYKVGGRDFPIYMLIEGNEDPERIYDVLLEKFCQMLEDEDVMTDFDRRKKEKGKKKKKG